MSNPSWFHVTNAAGAAEISIHDEISSFGVGFGEFDLALRAIKQPVIRLSLNSPGGLVDDGIAIYNALKAHPSRVEVYIPAVAASIATVIAMAGDTITIAPHARMMVHEAMAYGGGEAVGFAGDFDRLAQRASDMATRLRDCTANIASIYAERSHDAAYWLGKMAAESWFTDEEAVAEGLADEVGRPSDVGAFKVAANFNLLSKYRALNVADELKAVAEEERQPAEASPDEPESPVEPPADEPVVEPEAPAELDADQEPAEQTQPLNFRDRRRLAVDRVLSELAV